MSGTTPSFEALVAGWLARRQSANTRAAYAGDVGAFAQWCATVPVDPLLATGDHLDEFCDAARSAGAADSTIARRLSSLASFFEFARASGARAESPTGTWERATAVSSRTPALDTGEAAAVLDAAAALGPRVTALVALMLLDGCKLGEVVDADVEHVDLRSDPTTLMIRRRGLPQTLTLDARTADAIRAYVGDRATGPLLLGESPARDADRLTRYGADYIIKRAGAEAGIARPLTANTLRRSHVVHAHEQGTPLDTIRHVVGHRDRRTTQRYLEADGESDLGASLDSNATQSTRR